MGNSIHTSTSYFPEEYKTSFQGKVLIIGAGVSGMTAGFILNKLGVDYEIIEASSRYGGRIKQSTDLMPDFPIDIGAEWVHTGIKARPPILDELLNGKDPDFEIFPDSCDNVMVYNQSGGGLSKFNPVAKAILHSIGDYKFKKTTWFEWLDKKLYPIVKDFIRYNQPVNEINYQGSTVRVTTSAGEVFEADKVLVTVPITILQKELIKFTPPLPPKKVSAIKAERMPEGFKMFIEFTEQFYPDVTLFEGFWSSISTGEQSAFYNAVWNKNVDKNILGILVRGPRAVEYLEQVKNYANEGGEEKKLSDDDKLVKVVLKQLDKMYDGKATQCFVKSVVQNWSAEPFVQGTYSSTVWPRGSSYQDRISPLDNKVHFAGEAMNPAGYNVAVHGAIQSAYASLSIMLKEFESNEKKKSKKNSNQCLSCVSFRSK